MTTISNKTLNQFLALLTKKLKGDWLIVGGCVLHTHHLEFRVTADIDLVPINECSSADRIKIMEIAEHLSLPIESINLAAEYFVKKIPKFHNQLELIFETKNCRVFRPNLLLFIQLKIARLSESDLQDCIRLLLHQKSKLAPKFRKEINALIQKELEKQDSRVMRLQVLNSKL